MKKIGLDCFLSIVFVSLLTICLLATPSHAQSGFSDVRQNDWFYNDVTLLAESGVISGYPDGTFRPSAKVSRAEFIKLLTESMGYTYANYHVTLTGSDNANMWYSTYIAKALSNGVIFVGDFPNSDFDAAGEISRAEVAKYISRAIGLSPKPFVSPYVDTSDIYATALYDEMLMQGSINSDGKRNFYPKSGISRAECSAVISRLRRINENRVAYRSSAKDTFTGESLTLMQSPQTYEEFNLYLLHMLKNETYSVKFVYNGVSFGSERLALLKSTFFSAFKAVYNRHPEYASLLSAEVSTSGTSKISYLNIKLCVAADYDITLSELSKYRLQTASKVKSIISGIITPTMTTQGKADAIHDYIVSTTAYDTAPTGRSLSYLAYGALVEGYAVCQGYSSAFNMLCKEAGIRSCSVSSGVHMWNVALIDGTPYVYDVTWDDPIPDIPLDVCTDFRCVPFSSLTENHKTTADNFDLAFMY